MPERPYKGPHPTPGFSEKVANVAMPPMIAGLSGDQTADASNQFVGIARVSGQVVGVIFACSSCGLDNSNDLNFEGDLKINGVSCLDTKGKIEYISGEAAQQKTTHPDAEDTGITEAVVDYTANTFEPGDVLTWDFDITRTASPTTEIANPSVLVELLPEN